MRLFQPFKTNVDEWSDQHGLACPADESRTQQSFKEECDINTIVNRFGIGQFPPVSVSQLVAEVPLLDFRDAMERVRAGQMAFDAQPAAVRSRFGNDSAAFFEFVHDDRNRAEAERLGLLKAAPAARPAASETPSVGGAPAAAAVKTS